ncbi:multidrug effflux MFS transporter [Mucilaginibacter sp. HMF5004]|uniref:multidrug effflux MFS transporter n=1 Tax=Mucilaginibacter rivuli TaxID=2857527 RepID=UPI001C5F27E2|nr:multidrug effflux MFS transporter [Mucilaginibacter rivuli]MBW4889538.1 multidrug effflux MFS transporter [Mucilaginibacter rivuli]
MNSRERFFRILILGFLTALSPFSIDMYLPGFKLIAKDLHTTTNEVGLSLSSYFIGLAVGQLLYGPLLDRFGRKKPLYIGLVIYIAASVGCMSVTGINPLIALRFVQAVGGCAAAVAAVAMVRDLFPVNENAKIFSLLMLVVGLSPMLAPWAGTVVTSYFGWQSVFLTLGLIAVLILLAVIFKLPDGYKPNTSLSLKPGPIISNFLLVFKEPQFYTYAIGGAFAFSGIFTYVAGAPGIFMQVFDMDKQTFSYVFAGLSVAFIGSSQVNTLALRKYTSPQLVKAAITVQVLAGVVFLILSLMGLLDLIGVIAFIFIFLLTMGFISSNASALSLAPFAEHAGSASALMGAMQLGIGALTSGVLGMIVTISIVPMAAVMAGASLMAFLVIFIGQRNIKQSISAQAGAAVMH